MKAERKTRVKRAANTSQTRSPLKVGTATYNGIMPSFAHLKDEEVAALLNHLGQSFGNKNPKAFTAEEV